MAIGSKYWAHSYIISSGKKIYLEEYIWDVKKKLNAKEQFVSFKVSRMAFSNGAKEISVKTSSISECGEV